MPRQRAVDSILYSRPKVHQEDAEPKQLTLIAQLAWWNPHLWQRAITKQDRQTPRVELIGLLR